MPAKHTTHFETRKLNCLSKRDKSSAGRIDPRAVDVCAALNARAEYYTTSSCSGRCFLYCGDGIKSWHAGAADGGGGGGVAAGHGGDDARDAAARGNDDDIVPRDAKLGFFRRYRVNHDVVRDARRYFDLTTLHSGEDRTGGGDPVPAVGQFDGHGNNAAFQSKLEDHAGSAPQDGAGEAAAGGAVPMSPIWLRFEPFILHVMCRSLKAASALMATARPAFKNVGLTSFSAGGGDGEDGDDAPGGNDSGNKQCKGGGPRYLVAIWGDEGLDMPLSLPSSPGQGLFYHPDDDAGGAGTAPAEWLAQLINERHVRNWKKIDRFVEAVRGLDDGPVDATDDAASLNGVAHGIDRVDLDGNGFEAAGRRHDGSGARAKGAPPGLPVPRSYGVVGDVAILNSLPEGDVETQRKVGEWIMSKNKAMKICVARSTSLSTSNRSPGTSGLVQLAGPSRDPIVTSHYEYGVKCVVDLQNTFFSPRMAPERLRLSQQVARGERVLVVFAGVGMEALQIAARTEAKEVIAIEKNDVAAECLRRGKRALGRNKTATCPGGGKGAAARLSILEGDALELLPTLDTSSFDRIVAPRPKEGHSDGDLGTGDAGKEFLTAMLPLLKMKGEVHWYDFAADHELPCCNRTRETAEIVCQVLGLEMEVLHVAKVGSIAKRQFRVCMDFRIVEPTT